MKLRLMLLLPICLFLCSFLDEKETLAPSINSYIHEKVDSFYESSLVLQEEIQKSKPIDSIRLSYGEVQKKFRTIQFLLEHISEETVKKYFNGPPLLSLDQSIPAVVVLEPKGLQVIDEILFEDDPDYELLEKQVQDLCRSIQKTMNIFTRFNLAEADLKMAIYKDLVRIYTLQLTGFDTPGSLKGLENACFNFLGISSLIQKFFPDHPQLATVSAQCIRAANYLKQNQDFNSFDRGEFYRGFIRPALSELAAWKVNELPVLQRNPGQVLAINYQTGELFSEHFFNKAYYANLPEDLLKSDKLLALGKKLFYDPILSSDGKMSCATCHKPELAFTDGLQKSQTNVMGIPGNRNTPTLWNSIFTKGFFYDLREEDPSRQIAHVFRDKKEFNTDFIDVIDKLNAKADYKREFEEIFPVEKVNKNTITSSITAYVASLVDMDSPFDRYMRGASSEIDPAVIRGFNLFAGKAACATCHFIPTFSGLVPASYKESESEVLGVPSVWIKNGSMELDPDLGRYASGKPRDAADHLRFSFKTSTIRNIEKTAPYMHNGAFSDLESLMDFYNKGGGAGLGFELNYQTLSSDPLDLTKQEIEDLISFMKSLSGKGDHY